MAELGRAQTIFCSLSSIACKRACIAAISTRCPAMIFSASRRTIGSLESSLQMSTGSAAAAEGAVCAKARSAKTNAAFEHHCAHHSNQLSWPTWLLHEMPSRKITLQLLAGIP